MRPTSKFLLATWLLAGGAVAAPAPAGPAVPDDPAPAAKPAVAPVSGGTWSHAFAAYGEPKYPRGFKAFEYVNPDAPKGGVLYIQNPDRRTTWDKYNPFTIKGQSPAGLTTLMFETLAIRSGDEPATMYGALAEEMLVAPDRSSITFRIHPRARFYNGDPVLAQDVKHSYDMMTSKYAAPGVRTALEGISRVTVLDDRTIRFDLKDRTPDTIFNVGGIAVFSHKWGQSPDGTRKQFDEIVTEYPITSGPYTIGALDGGRRIEFVRDKNYWARDFGFAKGQYNFDKVVYRYYRDNAVAMEAFKAGEFDFYMEYSARRWARLHQGAKWDDGRIIKQVFDNGFGMGFQSYILNTRRPQLSDIRVRKAINLAYDFETVNVYKQYKHTNSMFANSEFAATGTPSPGELALLEPFRAELPPEVFGPAWVPRKLDESPNALRDQLKEARKLLEEAGWKLGPDGYLRNDKGELLQVELLDTGDPPGRAEAMMERNLKILGIKYTVRMVDFAIFRKRLETFDFDIAMIKIPDFTVPNVTELKDQYHSSTANVEGSGNYRGVKSKAIDHVLAKMEEATTMEQLRDATRALDRIVIYSWYQIPDLYAGNNRVSRWDKFGIPKVTPKYYTIATPSDWLQWSIVAWWDKSLEKTQNVAKN
jgi:peptide/nickel transport system substrate-binding protein/microcin C transport system substrate-binding protein